MQRQSPQLRKSQISYSSNIKGTITREEAIKRWTDIAETVFWAEGAIAKEWNPKLKAMVGKPSDECEAFAHEYCRAIAIEITNATSDEELAMEE